MNAPSLLALQVGNTRVQLGRFVDDKLEESHRFSTTDLAAILSDVTRMWNDLRADGNAAIALASVNEKVSSSLVSMLEDQLGVDVYRIGDDIPVPIGEALDPETIVGADRLLNAAAAWDRMKQACVIVDAGTAVTVDFIDGAGTFQGGAIAPGVRLQLTALHEHTDALPLIEFRRPTADAFGRNTSEAMLRGVFEGVRGLVWRLVERYAESYGAFPPVIATGGDAEVLFANDELVDRIVPDLTLQGMAVAVRYALTDGSLERGPASGSASDSEDDASPRDDE
ncbi:MAG: type III pantothenate kinase [Phycisphaerae bacterium]|nr:type III pantothenate kinase [Phycisphaerae bacterium]